MNRFSLDKVSYAANLNYDISIKPMQDNHTDSVLGIQ